MPTAAFDRIHELARELYPRPDLRYAYAVGILFTALENHREGQEILPADLESDQVEDYLAGQVIKSVLRAEAERPF
jgi:hypothetical protein